MIKSINRLSSKKYIHNRDSVVATDGLRVQCRCMKSLLCSAELTNWFNLILTGKNM